MDKNEILNELFDKKIIKIMRILFQNSESEYYLRELAKAARVSSTSTFRIVKKLSEAHIIDFRKVKKLTLYRWKPNEFLESIIGDKKSAIQEFVEEVSKLANIDEIILHGVEKKDKASILIIGSADSSFISLAESKIREKYEFGILSTQLQRMQYDQMSSMGLFPGVKRTLYKKI